jgi:ParB family chromosome partitioning protein
MTPHPTHATLLHMDMIRQKSNVRQLTDDKADAELQESIAIYGIMQPITVQRDGDTYTILTGHRRYLAARNLGMDRVPVIIDESPDNERTARQLVENLQRSDLKLSDTAKSVRKLWEDQDKSASTVALLLGKSGSWVSKMLAVSSDANAPKTRLLIEHEAVTDLESAHLLSLIERHAQRAEAQAILEVAAEGKMTRKEIGEKWAEIKARTKPATDEKDDGPGEKPAKVELYVADLVMLLDGLRPLQPTPAEFPRKIALIALLNKYVP